MNKLLLASALLMCGTMTVSAQNVTKVTGEAGKADMVYLYPATAREAADSAKVVNGKFEMNVKLDNNTIAYILTKDKHNVAFVPDGQALTVNLETGAVSGSAINTKFAAVNADINSKNEALYATYSKIMELDKQKTEAAQKEIEVLAEQLNKASEQLDEDIMKVIDENKDNMIGLYFLSNKFREMDYDTLLKYVNKDSKLYDNPMMAPIRGYMANLEKKAPGKMFMDASIPDQNGKMHKLSEWCGTGKVVLIDFWASWCGPCRQEMPNVVANYNKYKDMGFEVIGISFDQNKDAWLNGVKKLGMEWPQLSELKSWNNEAGRLYGIQSIPSNVLVGKDGKIIALDLRGEALGNTLKGIFGK